MKRHRVSLLCGALLLVIGLCLCIALGACGGSTAPDSTNDTPTATATASPSATGPAALVPDAIKQTGILKVGTNLPYPPMEYFKEDGKTFTGVDIDLTEAVAKILGLKVEWVNMNWDGLRPALQSKHFDMVVASMGDFTDRQAQVTFVDYLEVGEGVLVKAADAASITKPEDLAGKPMGASKGTVAVSIADELNDELKSEGLEAMSISTFSGDGPGTLAVRSGRIFGFIMDLPTAVYRAQSTGGGQTYAVVLANLMGGIPYGMAVRKDADGEALAKAVQAALNEMIADGSYQQILDTYGLSGGAIDSATINGGTTSSGS